MALSDIIRSRRHDLRLSQTEVARRTGVHLRQIARYEAGEQQPALPVAVALADALEISLTQLAGQVSYELDLSGAWWAGWQTWNDDMPQVDTHTLEIHQRGELLHLDAEPARAALDGSSYRWRGELRLWDNEVLMGWYRSTDGAARAKGTLYLTLHPHGTQAWGRWVGMTNNGPGMTGWAVIARTERDVRKELRELIDPEPH